AAGGDTDVAAGGDDAVEGGAGDHEGAEDGGGFGAPGVEIELFTVAGVAQGELADGGFGQRGLGDGVDHESAGGADAFAAIVLEGHGVFVAEDEVFVQHVEGFEHRHVGVEVVLDVADHFAEGGPVGLTPDVEGEFHWRVTG